MGKSKSSYRLWGPSWESKHSGLLGHTCEDIKSAKADAVKFLVSSKTKKLKLKLTQSNPKKKFKEVSTIRYFENL